MARGRRTLHWAAGSMEGKAGTRLDSCRVTGTAGPACQPPNFQVQQTAPPTRSGCLSGQGTPATLSATVQSPLYRSRRAPSGTTSMPPQITQWRWLVLHAASFLCASPITRRWRARWGYRLRAVICQMRGPPSSLVRHPGLQVDPEWRACGAVMGPRHPKSPQASPTNKTRRPPSPIPSSHLSSVRHLAPRTCLASLPRTHPPPSTSNAQLPLPFYLLLFSLHQRLRSPQLTPAHHLPFTTTTIESTLIAVVFPSSI